MTAVDPFPILKSRMAARKLSGRFLQAVAFKGI